MSASAAVQNNEPATEGGVTGKGFKPGQSGNPGGRPKGLAKAARERVSEQALTDFWASIMEDPDEKMERRLEASKLLADRGYGKAVEVKQQDEEDPLGLNDARDKLMGKLATVVSLDEQRGEGPVPAGTSSEDTGA